MKTIRNLSLSTLLLAGLSFGQTATPQTTLAAPMSRGDKTITLAASTFGGYTVQAAQLAPLTGLYVDHEYMTIAVTGNVSGNIWNVVRATGSEQGLQSTHAVGTVVWAGPPGGGGVPFDQGPYDRVGACTASLLAYLPIIEVRTGNLTRCVAGRYVQGILPNTIVQPYTSFTTFSGANPVATASVTDVAGTIWFSQINITSNATLTGACVLNGATVGTDARIVALYDALGALVAQSTSAGTTTATASKFQCMPFVASGTGTAATVSVVGPATYFVAIQTAGTTDNFQAYAAGSAPTLYGTQSQTGTFPSGVTVPLVSMTTPTNTFTASKGPIMMVY